MPRLYFLVPNLTTDSIPYWEERLDALSPDHERRWGKLTAHGMVCHLKTAMTGMLTPSENPKPPTLKQRLLRIFILNLLPWPRGKIRVEDRLTPDPTDHFEDDVQRVKELLHQFCDLTTKSPDQIINHPIFGAMPLSLWQKFHGRHLHHHFTQFGV